MGKSCLLLRFIDDSFEEVAPTIGVDFKLKHVVLNKKRLRLTVWDTGAQCPRDCWAQRPAYRPAQQLRPLGLTPALLSRARALSHAHLVVLQRRARHRLRCAARRAQPWLLHLLSRNPSFYVASV